MLDGVRQSWGVRAPGRLHLLGTSGTVTTVAGIHLGLDRYDRARVDGAWLGASHIAQVVDRLMTMSFEERVANPCIGAQRADSCSPAVPSWKRCGAFSPPIGCVLPIADCVRMLVQMMRADGVWRNGRPAGGFVAGPPKGSPSA